MGQAANLYMTRSLALFNAKLVCLRVNTLATVSITPPAVLKLCTGVIGPAWSVQGSHTGSESQWQPKAGPVMFQGVDLNSLGCHRYCSESPALQALSAQGSIRLLPGLDLPLEIFEAQFGTATWTVFTYLTVPAIGYHAICAICILDLMFFDRDRWWIDPVPRFFITAAGLEIVVVLQTVSMLLAAIADSAPAHADIYKVLPGGSPALRPAG